MGKKVVITGEEPGAIKFPVYDPVLLLLLLLFTWLTLMGAMLPGVFTYICVGSIACKPKAAGFGTKQGEKLAPFAAAFGVVTPGVHGPLCKEFWQDKNNGEELLP